MSYYLKLYSETKSFEPLQLDQLAKLGQDIKEDVVSELLTLHFTVATATMAHMQRFHGENNLREIAFLAHQFKSNCGQLGLVKLHRALNDLENLIRFEGADPEKVSDLLKIIRDENDICLNYLIPYQKEA